MESFTPTQWFIVALVLILGLILGMFLMAGGKWKGRYREEARLRTEDRRRITELEAENERMRREHGEMTSLRGAAARDDARHRDDTLARDDTRHLDDTRHRDDTGHRDDTSHRDNTSHRDDTRRRDDSRGPL
jgi:uncharacterized membrane-anchored protein YhcB (DUF1043 family)